jgi:hypothetical protein
MFSKISKSSFVLLSLWKLRFAALGPEKSSISTKSFEKTLEVLACALRLMGGLVAAPLGPALPPCLPLDTRWSISNSANN